MNKLSDRVNRLAPSATLAMSQKSQELKAQGVDVINMSVGEPDFNTPDAIKAAAKQAIDDNWSRYSPVPGYPSLRKAIVEKLKNENGLEFKESQISVSNGAKQAVCNAIMALVNPGDEVIVPAPYWVSYPEMIKLADGVPVIIKSENGFKISVADLEKALTPKTKAVVINSPCNPTGLIYNEDELRAIAGFAVENNLYIISDEIYEKLVYDGEKHVSIATFGDDIKERTIIVNGLSKSHSMTGWRIGFTASNPKLAKAMSNMQSHATSNPNSIAQKAALAAYEGNDDFVEMMKKEFVKRRNYMVERINSIDGLSCEMPNGAFYVMMNITSAFGKEYYGNMIENSDDFCGTLLDVAKVGLVPGSGFCAEGFSSLSYATSMENIKEGLDRIEKFMKGMF